MGLSFMVPGVGKRLTSLCQCDHLISTVGINRLIYITLDIRIEDYTKMGGDFSNGWLKNTLVVVDGEVAQNLKHIRLLHKTKFDS